MDETNETNAGENPPPPGMTYDPAAATGAPAAEVAPVVLPEAVDYDELQALKLPELHARFRTYNVRINPDRNRNQLIADLLRFFLSQRVKITVDGVLDLAQDGSHGYLRSPRFSFKALPQDPFVPGGMIRQFGLRPGNRLYGTVRGPRDHRDRALTVDEVAAIEGKPAAEWVAPKQFDALTATFPKQRIVLENERSRSLSPRAVDLISPLGRGQRALIIAPPRVGKTILLKDIAKAIRVNSPETELILLLIDERPEEVTDFRREVDTSIFSSTFDENPQRHVQLAELVSERAKRLVECGRDVVILLDSITRLARGYNNLQPGKGRIMSGGVDTKALLKPKKFFGAARSVEEGGSLTIIATALVETQSRMDDVIFEEFKGTGNAEVRLDRTLAERRLFPAIHVLNSGTRRDDLLYHPQEFEKIQIIRRTLAALPAVEAMELLLKNLGATRSNAELLMSGLRDR
jgi:transcription termination factor Rho